MSYTADPRVDAYIDALPGWQQAICREGRDLVHAPAPDGLPRRDGGLGAGARDRYRGSILEPSRAGTLVSRDCAVAVTRVAVGVEHHAQPYGENDHYDDRHDHDSEGGSDHVSAPSRSIAGIGWPLPADRDWTLWSYFNRVSC